jgi:hypothetical protein
VSLFGADDSLKPRWTRDFAKAKGKDTPRLALQYRVENQAVEIREIPEPPAQPQSWWDPVIKIGLKKGEAWSSEMPDGRQVSYSVVDFGKDENGRDTLSIHRVEKHPKQPGVWQERTITYVRGLGEVKRVVSEHRLKGAVAVLELRLVQDESEVPSLESKVPIAPVPATKGN